MSFWDSLGETLGETWDVALDYGNAIVSEKVQDAKESGRDAEQLKTTEPVKGTSATGAPIVVDKAVSQPAQSQLIGGVDNTYLAIGGAALVSLVLLFVIVKK